jgi:hypothetical protein
MLEETVDSYCCVVLTLTPFFRGVRKDEKMYGCFMQDSAMVHTVNFLLIAQEEVFRKWLMSHRLWPHKSPDLNPSSYVWRC